jgi:hypothetical protein
MATNGKGPVDISRRPGASGSKPSRDRETGHFSYAVSANPIQGRPAAPSTPGEFDLDTFVDEVLVTDKVILDYLAK